MDSEEIKRMVITGMGRGKPPEHSRFAKGQSGNPKGRPRKAQQPVPTLADQPTLSTLLNIANRTVDVRQDGKSVSMSRGDAVMESLVVNAIKGNPKSQGIYIGMMQRAEAALAAERRSSNELWSNYKRNAYAQIAAAKKQGLPPPALVPHPDDIIIDPSNDVRFIGPIDDEEQARLEQTLKLRDVLIMQSALDNRSTHRLDGEPLTQPGSAEMIAMLLDRAVPPRLRLPSINWAIRCMQYEGMPKRELLKSLFTSWRKLKPDVPRGFVFPNMSGVVRHVTMINTLLADIQSGMIDPDAITVEEFAEEIQERAEGR